MKDERLNKLASLLVNYSTKVKKDDFVFVTCEDVAVPWMTAVVNEAVKKGAHVETMITSHEVSEVIMKNSTKEQLLCGNFIFENVLKKADVWLSAWATSNTKFASNIEIEKMQYQSRGANGWRKIYSDRMGTKELRWCGTQFPTFANAQDASMSLSEYEDFVYGAGLMNCDDPVAEWNKISKKQQKWADFLTNKSLIHIVGEDTDISINTKGRKWINCDGEENFPDGEVFTSPVENDINGHIKFSYPLIYRGREIENIYLEVKNGKIVKASADKGEDFLKSILETDEGSLYFGEAAVGTNYAIKQFTRNILFDEKIGGTIHMAIGDSFGDAGGKNKSSIHLDMIKNMRNGGELYADGKLIYKDGIFLDIV